MYDKLYDEIIVKFSYDSKDLAKEYDYKIKKIESENDSLLVQIEKMKKYSIESNKKYNDHLLSKQIIKKQDKQKWKEIKSDWKNTKITLRDKYNFHISKISSLNLELQNNKNSIFNLTNERENKLSLLKYDVENLTKTIKENDKYICSELKVTALQTKIKILLKEYDIERIQSNPRVGISLGTNFKPRIYMSTNARVRTKKIVTRNEIYEIRKNDDFDIRIEEIANTIGITNPFNLYEFVTKQIYEHNGNQYLKEFIKMD